VIETKEKCNIGLGRVSLTAAAKDALKDSGVSLDALLLRHRLGDWGEMAEESKRENDLSALGLLSAPLVSAYELPNVKDYIFVITDADQSETLVLLPDV
jgi:hypothetical protein